MPHHHSSHKERLDEASAGDMEALIDEAVERIAVAGGVELCDRGSEGELRRGDKIRDIVEWAKGEARRAGKGPVDGSHFTRVLKEEFAELRGLATDRGLSAENLCIQLENSLGARICKHLRVVGPEVAEEVVCQRDGAWMHELWANSAWSEGAKLKLFDVRIEALLEGDKIVAGAEWVFLKLCVENGIVGEEQKNKLLAAYRPGCGRFNKYWIAELLATCKGVDQLELYRAVSEDLDVLSCVLDIWQGTTEVRSDVFQELTNMLLARERTPGQAGLLVEGMERMAQEIGLGRLVEITDVRLANEILEVIFRHFLFLGEDGGGVLMQGATEIFCLALERPGDWIQDMHGEEREMLGKVFATLSNKDKARALKNAEPQLSRIFFAQIGQGPQEGRSRG